MVMVAVVVSLLLTEILTMSTAKMELVISSLLF